MATESPMRLVGSSVSKTWPPSKNATAFDFGNMEGDELGLLMKSYEIHEDQADKVPNRSGSAPPSMEGSFTAVGNMISQQNPAFNPCLASLCSSFENYESEEQLRADPAYLAYYCSNVNLNPRLPPPLISRESRRLVRHIGGFGNNWRLTSFDDSVNGSANLSHGILSTHKEELEDDKSAKTSDDQASGDSADLSQKNASASEAHHSTLIDLKQGGDSHIPCPVYSKSHSSAAAPAEEQIVHDIEAIVLNDTSLDRNKSFESRRGSVGVGTSALDADVIAFVSNNNPPSASFPSLSCSDGTGSSKPRDIRNDKDAISKNNVPVYGVAGFDFSVESKMRSLNASSLPAEDSGRNRREQHIDRNIPQRSPAYLSTASVYQVHGVQPHLISQGSNSLYSSTDKLVHVLPKLSSGELHPVLPPGITPPFYATTPYLTSGNHLYPNLQASGLFAPQYNMSSYAPALFPPFVAGYPSQSAFPMPFNLSSGHNFNGRTSGVSTGESAPHMGDYQHLNKNYEHHGVMLQPSLVDPLHMQYLQPAFEVSYGSSGQYGQLTSGGDVAGQMDSFVLRKDVHHRSDFKVQAAPSGIPMTTPKKGGGTGSNYYGSSPSMGVLTPYPPPALANPLLTGSPGTVTSLQEPRNELIFHQNAIRNTGVYSGWHGQRRGDSFDEPRKHSFLEDLKSNSARKFELQDIAGRIVEFSVDQHGSRFIQQKLENCGAEDKASVFKEVLPHASKLMTDVFGNYVIQKFFEHGSHDQRKELADQLPGQMVSLSLQMYGCRVIQKALEVIDLDQKTQLVRELDGHVMRCVRDQNGNHVIQKCIECVPTEKICFIIDAFRGQVATLSTHPYGCRVIQRLLEHCSDETQSQCIVDEILESACVLAQDQYGNYVTQHVLDRGKPYERSQIITKMSGKIVQMSQHKYASNVVEKCLEHGDASERDLLIQEIIGESEESDSLLIMMKDQFANYVVQKILEISNDRQREMLLKRVRIHLNALKKYTYGKHIVARFEQLYGEECQSLDHP